MEAVLKPKVFNLENKKNEITTIFHIVEDYLQNKYEFRYNNILCQIETTIKNKNQWIVTNENELYRELQKLNIKIKIGDLKCILSSDFVPLFNPLKAYFENLPKWDNETDYITEFANFVEFKDDIIKKEFVHHFKKWCVRSVHCALEIEKFNKQCLVLVCSKQDIGKSTFLRYLCPKNLVSYSRDNLPENNKDAKIDLSRNFLINLDELANLSTLLDAKKLKELISLDKINERLPFGRKNDVLYRVANFVGSTNETAFLRDETGSIRWLCFEIKSINFEYKGTIDINNLWTQAYSLYQDKDFIYELTKEEKTQNELRNDKFQKHSKELELINKYLSVPNNVNDSDIEFMTATDVLIYIKGYAPGLNIYEGKIGEMMKKAGFIRDKYGKPNYCYAVKKEYKE
jgi:predicted P-loop ATPase